LETLSNSSMPAPIGAVAGMSRPVSRALGGV
jgi:hypothetical protein